MGDYFNEDDLINDYIADAEEEEPPYYDDEYMEEPAASEQVANTDAATAADALKDGNDVDVSGGADNPATEEDNDAANNRVSADDNSARPLTVVPPLISTTTSEPTASSWRNDTRSNKNIDLYGFERYAGLTSWRTNDNSANGAMGGEKGGATTMEATSWKKKEIHPKMRLKRGDEMSDDADSIDSDTDDLDNRKRGRNTNNANHASSGIAGRGSYGASNKGGEAQLVRFRERDEAAVMGRSWGNNVVGSRGSDSSDARTVHANKSMPTLGEDSMPITLADGTRTFVKRGGGRRGSTREEPTTTTTNGGSESKEKREECLLGMPMTELVRRANVLQKRAIQRKLERRERYGESNSAEVEDSNDASLDADMEDAPQSNEFAPGDDSSASRPDRTREKEIRRRQQSRKRHREAMQLQQRLWVDKHAPSSISHLLSDERTNREVLRALRAWDPYVFKREAPARPAPAYPSRYGQGGQDGNDRNGKWRKKGDRDGRDETEGEDGGNARADVRPAETARVLLLSGPPGVGKSTLAHIVCKHAGYRPIEVNASDERTASALTERVVRAMESSTLDFGGGDAARENVGGGSNGKRGGKPNCIILDEVDGADAKASIAALVDIIRADIPSPGASKSKKGKSNTYLRRPIILICNHKYAPALRPILPYARQFDVRPPNTERLAGRLRAVLSSERMSVVAGGMLLHRLVSATGGDVRSCLYALQFASARAREVAMKKQREREAGGLLSKGDKGAMVVDISSTLMAALGDKGNGMKDMQSDVSSTVATVFRKAKGRNPNKRRNTSDGSSSSSNPKGVDLVLKTVDHFGDNSKTLDCLFLNVHRVSYVDPTLDRAYSALEWLSGADTYRSHKSNVASNNGPEFMSMQKFHMPSAAAAVHLLCCVETRPDLSFSTRPMSDLHYRTQANVSLVHRFVEGLAPRARRGVGGGTDAVVSDVLPYGLWLLSAGDGKHSLSRPVSSVDILSDEERVAFGAHVATLRALGLTYVKDERTDYDNRDAASGGDNVRLEPEIDKLVKFEDAGDDAANDGVRRRKEIPTSLKELLAHGAAVAAMRERESDARMAQREAAAAAEEKKVAPKIKAKAIAPKVAEKSALAGTTPKKQPPAKAGLNTSAAKNFLGLRAAKAKAARTAQRAARVGLSDNRSTGSSKKVKLSNTGSGVELSKVIRFKYQKGFTQAVRAPCQLEDLL